MSGLLALLDDVVALTKVAAATLDDVASQAARAGAKAAGVVIDDAAVTPRYVTGLAAQRELPIIWRIARGSLKNKLLILLPAALVLSAFLPWAITPLLMVGLYLSFEGYEKVHHILTHAPSDPAQAAAQVVLTDAALEDAKVTGAIRTDLVLSAEIMAIALASITATDVMTQALTLLVVGILITAGVYGTVAVIVKADDVGVALACADGPISGPLGRALVHGMPPFLGALSFIGMLAMLWVGGGILVHGLAEYGIGGPEHLIEIASGFAEQLLPKAGGVLAWITAAAGAAVVGVLVGALLGPPLRVLRFPLEARIEWRSVARWRQTSLFSVAWFWRYTRRKQRHAPVCWHAPLA